MTVGKHYRGCAFAIGAGDVARQDPLAGRHAKQFCVSPFSRLKVPDSLFVHA